VDIFTHSYPLQL